MKRLFFAAMLLLGISTMLCSCNKEGNGTKGDLFEGRYWVFDKQEELFNGKVVNTERAPESTSRIYFSGGNATIENTDGTKSVYAYSLIDNELTIGGTTYYMNPNTKEFYYEQEVLEFSGYSQITQENCVSVFKYDGQPILIGKGDYFIRMDYNNYTGCDFIYGTNLKACGLVGLTKTKEPFNETLIGKSGSILYQQKLYANTYTLERINDKEVILWRDASENYGDYSHSTRITFDYPYDVIRTTFRQE